MRQPPASALQKVHGQPDRRLPVFVSGRRNRLLILVCALLLAGTAQAIDTVALRELSQLARSGAPQLALRRMDAEQPAFETEPADWMTWERERLQILRSQGMDRALLARVAALPSGVGDDFLHQALTFAAESRLRLGENAAALAGLRALIWRHGEHADAAQMEAWRRLVVRAYVREGRVEDARLALLRYRQDYGDDNAEFRWLSARVMLQGGRAASAMKLLQGVEQPRSRFLYQLAALQSGEADPEGVLHAAEAAAGAERTPPGLQRAWWSLAARAAARAGRQRDEILYLERALGLPADPELALLFPAVNADSLWRRYLDLGQQIGNDEQRLLGSDEDWYFPAVEVMEKDPLRARVFFAVLAEYTSDPRRRSLAHEYLVGLLDALPNGPRLVRTLYLEAARFADVDTLPSVVRYRLIDKALAAGELQTASRLMAGLAEPPRGQDRFEWTLRRARVAIYTGDVDAGVAMLRALLDDSAADWSAGRGDRLVQILFDLQTVRHHREALGLFGALLDKPLEARQRRELLFWMAESLEALEQYDQAAYLYIKSATLTDPLAMDPWAQTARYRAAKALVSAGLLDDARRIFTSLMHATRDAGRKAVLKSEIQRLGLVARPDAGEP